MKSVLELLGISLTGAAGFNIVGKIEDYKGWQLWLVLGFVFLACLAGGFMAGVFNELIATIKERWNGKTKQLKVLY